MSAQTVDQITPADIAKLTPGQKQQAKMIAEYSRDSAYRYIANILHPEMVEAIAEERSRQWFHKALAPLERGQLLTVGQYATALEIHPCHAGAQLADLIKEGFVFCGGRRSDPTRTHSITQAGLTLLSLGNTRFRIEKEGYQSALITKSTAHRDEIMIGIEEPIKLLNRIKNTLLPHKWDVGEFFTTEQVASYYEISEQYTRTVVCSARRELEAEGITTLIGAAATHAKRAAAASLCGGRFTLWSARAVLRFGLILRESEVAIWLRQALVGGAK